MCRWPPHAWPRSLGSRPCAWSVSSLVTPRGCQPVEAACAAYDANGLYHCMRLPLKPRLANIFCFAGCTAMNECPNVMIGSCLFELSS